MSAQVLLTPKQFVVQQCGARVGADINASLASTPADIVQWTGYAVKEIVLQDFSHHLVPVKHQMIIPAGVIK